MAGDFVSRPRTKPRILLFVLKVPEGEEQVLENISLNLISN